MSHTPKARSIGSLPLPHQLRLTPCEPSPLPIRSPSTASPLANSSSIMSPSRLPASDCMSYFPPFECMGSGPSSPAAEAGPSTESTTSSDSERGHAKGRSLGSLAGLMTLLSPASSPHRTSTSSSATPHSIPTVYRSTSDGDVLQALAKRVTPGKRRVLEPITLTNDHLPEAVRYRRRRTSSADVVIRRKLGNGAEETTIEALTPSHLRRRTKPRLVVPIPALPVWRFPFPSPPVTSLSPDIPLSAFSPIDNPASNPSSTESSPAKPLTPSCLSREHFQDDYPDEGLSPTASYYGSFSSGASRPTTPNGQEGKERWMRSSPDSIRTIDDDTRLYPRLERSTSSMSSDSKETIRPSKEKYMLEGSMLDGETTPKATKG